MHTRLYMLAEEKKMTRLMLGFGKVTVQLIFFLFLCQWSKSICAKKGEIYPVTSVVYYCCIYVILALC